MTRPVSLVPMIATANLRAEAERIAAIKARAAIPDRCGPEVEPAPARGAFAVFTMREMVPGSAERMRPAGYKGRDTVRVADAFDVMEEQARRAWAKLPEKDRPPFQRPFTDPQIAMARRYLALTERRAAGGVRCASLEALRSGGGQGGEFIDAFVAEGAELASLHRRIGGGVAMVVRRIRPSARGANRAAILDRRLVDDVCLRGLTLTEVLRAHGWAKDAAKLVALRVALAASLDRMIGYGSGASHERG